VCVGPTDPCGLTAPVCNGSCPTGETCTFFGTANTPNCGCIPDGSTACGGTPGVCGGVCPSGEVCTTVFELPALGGDPLCTCATPGECGATGLECPPGFGCALIPPDPPICVPVGCPGSWTYPGCGGDCGVGATCAPIDVFGFQTCVCSSSAAVCDTSCSGYLCPRDQTCAIDSTGCSCVVP